MEFETVKEGLEQLYDISQADLTIIRTYDTQNCDNLLGERKATVKDMQEIIFESVVSIADLLGLEEIYLSKE